LSKQSANGTAPVSLRRSTTASYASQLYATAIGILMVPMYLKYMGTEAYGLIGLFAILQLVIQSLDIGITPTLSREAARSRAGATTALSLRRLLRSFEVIFAIAGLLIIVAILWGAGLVATRWVKAGDLGAAEIERALVLMTATAWIRWFAGLYRGLINGFAQQVWLSGVSFGISTAHSILIIPFLVFVGASPAYFFSYQLVVALIEFSLLAIKAYGLIPRVDRDQPVWWQLDALRRVFHFSATVALTTALWVVVAQTDKILLSKILSLSDFGKFAVATLVAGGVSTLSIPLSNTLLPRLTELVARGDTGGFVSVYRKATQFTAVMILSAALFLALFAEPVLRVWTGSPTIALASALPLTLYALGNGAAAVGAFPYYLQYAQGNLSLHLVGTVLYLLVLVPSTVVLSLKFGPAGAGSAWLGANVVFLVCWVPYVHRRYLGTFHAQWLYRDVATIAIATGAIGIVARFLIVWPDSRLVSGAILVLLALLLLLTATLTSPFARHAVLATARNLRLRGSGAGA
jgi:O-antigen/teichoic acid export membrane protein